MDKAGQVIMAIFGGIITLAVLAVIVSRKSQTPEVLQAASSALANVVGAAVAPINTNSGSPPNNGNSTFSTPNFSVPGFNDPVFGVAPPVNPASGSSGLGGFLHNFLNPWR
jgi:hypothetical protein